MFYINKFDIFFSNKLTNCPIDETNPELIHLVKYFFSKLLKFGSDTDIFFIPFKRFFKVVFKI